MANNNMFMYTVYLKSGNIVTVLGSSSIRDEEFTEIYKFDIKGKKYVTARFENEGIEGVVIKEIKEVNADGAEKNS